MSTTTSSPAVPSTRPLTIEPGENSLTDFSHSSSIAWGLMPSSAASTAAS